MNTARRLPLAGEAVAVAAVAVVVEVGVQVRGNRTVGVNLATAVAKVWTPMNELRTVAAAGRKVPVGRHQNVAQGRRKDRQIVAIVLM